MRTWPMPRLQQLRRGGAACLSALVLAVVLGPWLGALHRLVHWGSADAHVHAASGFEDVFGPHERALDCLVYDQLSQGGSAPAAAPALPPLACPACPAWSCLKGAPAPVCASFQARAPPGHCPQA